MAVLPFTPSYSSSVQTKPRLRMTGFGSGYKLRKIDGIHPTPDKWDLKFRLTSANWRTLQKFLRDNLAQSIDWTPPEDGSATGEVFAAGNNVQAQWQLTSNGNPVYLPLTSTVYRTDWQGTYQLYSTARTNLLLNSLLVGGGAAPTGWTQLVGTGTSTPVTSLVGSPGTAYLQTATAQQPWFYIINTVLANTTYTLSCVIESVSGGLTAVNTIKVAGLPAGATFSYPVCQANPEGGIAGVVQAGVLLLQVVVAGTAGNCVSRFGLGAQGSNVTGTIQFSSPQFEVGTTRTGFIPTPVGASATITDYTVSASGLVTLASTTNPVAAQSLGTASGSTATFAVVTPNGSTPTVLNVWRTDWQGRQRMYPTARTNLVLNSSDSTLWTHSESLDYLQPITSPSGSSVSYVVAETTNNMPHSLSRTLTAPAGSMTYSVYAKAQTRKRFLIRENSVTGAASSFDLSTGTVVANAGGGVGSITDMGGGWFRCSLVCTPTAGARVFAIYLLQDSGTAFANVTYAGTANAGIWFWGMQTEAGSITSYIPTGAAAVTVTDWSQSASNVLFASNPLAGSLIEADYTWVGAAPAGTSFSWTGTFTRRWAALEGWSANPVAYNHWEVSIQLEEVFV